MYYVGVDTGGTFTDCVVIDESGAVFKGKASSTPHDFAIGVMNALRVVAEEINLTLEELMENGYLFGHGCTVGINALVTRTGARTGLVTTKGYEDTIFIGRMHQKIAGLSEEQVTDYGNFSKAVPIIPRPLVKGISERIDSRGQVIVPLDIQEVTNCIHSLVQAGVDSIAVCLLWSFMNPAHEQTIKRLIVEEFPDLFVTISSEISPIIKEYERMNTTAINSYVGPVTTSYISKIGDRLKSLGMKGYVNFFQSSGGSAGVNEVITRPIGILQSGPAGGVMAARALGKRLEHQNIISTDVGGTTFDVGVIFGGEAELNQEPIFDKYHVSIPSVDVVSIGAGGGSIARVESGFGINRLLVGPGSAGAVPGPVCYNLGGVEPTVTDADVVLGYIDPDYFLGGKMKISYDAAYRAIEAKVASPLGISVLEAAAGIVQIIDNKMADMVRKVTLRKGFDPRDFVIYAFGGGGPVHVGSYGKNAGCEYAVIPAQAAVFSAEGVATADNLRVKQISKILEAPFDAEEIRGIIALLEEQIVDGFLRDGWYREDLLLERFIALRLKGQTHELQVPVEMQPSGIDLTKLVNDFKVLYEQRYGAGTARMEAGINAVTFVVKGIACLRLPEFRKQNRSHGKLAEAKKKDRMVYFSESSLEEVPIYDGLSLVEGRVIKGPAIVENPDTNIVIHPGQDCYIDEYNNFILKL